jgi:murein DD-endopeptidase MepM/ murein hydrolase activator NlpD
MYTGVQWVDGHCYNFGTSGAETAEPWNDGWSWPFPQAGEGYFLPGQRFGYSSYPRENGYHDGLDFGSSDHPGSAVHAVHGGKVLDVNTVRDDQGKTLWWFVTIYDGKYLYVYQEAFSNRNKITVSRNDIVYPGQVIGYRDLGHLHLGINTSPNYGEDLAHSFQPSWSDSSQPTGGGTWLNPETVIRNHG